MGGIYMNMKTNRIEPDCEFVNALFSECLR